MITVDATKLLLTMDVSDAELEKRKAAWKQPPPNVSWQADGREVACFASFIVESVHNCT